MTERNIESAKVNAAFTVATNRVIIIIIRYYLVLMQKRRGTDDGHLQNNMF